MHPLLLTAAVLCAGCDCGLGSQVCAGELGSEQSTVEPGAMRGFELAITSAQVSPERELRSQSLSIAAETDTSIEQLSVLLFDDQGTLIDEGTPSSSTEGTAVVFEREIGSLEGRFSFFIEIDAPGIQAPVPIEITAYLQYCEETRGGSEDREVELRFCPDAC